MEEIAVTYIGITETEMCGQVPQRNLPEKADLDEYSHVENLPIHDS